MRLARVEPLHPDSRQSTSLWHFPSTRLPFFLVQLPVEPNSNKMSYITRRALSTLIPPKIASPNAIGAAQDAARMERVVNFYAKLPRGAAPETKPTGLLGRYQARYFNKSGSVTPLIHAVGGILLLGYSMEYYFHLRHHKNHPH